MVRILLVWLISALALIAVANVVPGVAVARFWPDAVIAALVLGLINTLIKPVLVILTLPVTVLTLGLFLLILNGLMFWAAGSLLEGFRVAGFWPGVFGAIVYSLITWAASLLLPRRSD